MHAPTHVHGLSTWDLRTCSAWVGMLSNLCQSTPMTETSYFRVSNEIEGTWAGYANDGRSLEGALGSYMTSQIARVERIMHEDGARIPWLEQHTQESPVGERSSNINIEPAIFFKTTSCDGRTRVSGAEFFVVRSPHPWSKPAHACRCTALFRHIIMQGFPQF